MCEKCGYDKSQHALCFHHKKGKLKSFMISNFRGTAKSVTELSDEIINELEKCDLLCLNCHQKEHINIQKVLDNMDYIEQKIKEYKPQRKNDHEAVLVEWKKGTSYGKMVKMGLVKTKSMASWIINKSKQAA